MTFAYRVLGFIAEEACLAMKRSRNSTCSVMVLCVKRPLTVMSRHKSAFMSIPKQRSHSNMLLSKDMSGPTCINFENRAQAAPIDSFSHCSKSRIVLGREPIRDMGKKSKTKFVLKFIPVPICTLYGVCVPLLRPSCEGEGK
jgi:hypothetical protein